ncbi:MULTISPECIES: LytS/YhcK type 5TM receptor domain-containing protein [Paenibacillus]|uniref:histidine kinase n=1 Tax=Paenibacillus campinasensis TaxID=66347 RepID=A0A268EW45_9BACL|nr:MULTISPECIES: LytS/YhcK type 5TM receptor domain-containing protein [Paenibacillus]MUG68479.1 sensor histidine kinase [Paenibacillus campinasensis]PAD77347.1 sensor histidine kinase [Paenibacillus campinasensis]PAK50311.1 sensor histidine kinase [Paenibacillus sp. 7541]
MQELALHLFERMGMLLILTFILTRIPLFRQLLDRREISGLQTLLNAFLFGLFGILGTYAGVVVEGKEISSSFWLLPLQPDQALAHAALVGVVIGGLIGGPRVGFGGGLLAGAHLFYMGGYTGLAGLIAAPLTGILAGGVARFFSQERVVSPAKALFVGMFAEVLYMGVILICADDAAQAIELVDLIGLPMVLTGSIAIAIFTTMLRVALAEEERAAAYETEKALHIAEAALPHLKQGLTYRTAQAVADLLLRELKTTAVAVTDTERFLAHAGAASRTIDPGEPIASLPARQVISTGVLQVVEHEEDIQPRHPSLGAAILVPMMEGARIVGVIQLYFKRPQDIGRVELAMARGLGQLISYQLGATSHENMAKLMKEAELKLLQAQIHPHFLYNTLNAIHSLIRTDPQLARHATMQLGAFMRLNGKVMASRRTTIREEMELLGAYLDIIQIRFEHRFAFHSELEPDLMDLHIPPATLQMLVENSIKHGFRHTARGGIIRLSVYRDGDMAVIRLEDNGCGIAPAVLERLGERPLHEAGGSGIGIYNINQRLMSLFGRETRLMIENLAEGGCGISFRIPIRISEGGQYLEAN